MSYKREHFPDFPTCFVRKSFYYSNIELGLDFDLKFIQTTATTPFLNSLLYNSILRMFLWEFCQNRIILYSVVQIETLLLSVTTL